MKRKSKKPVVRKTSLKDKKFEALLRRAAELSRKKAENKTLEERVAL